MGAMGESDAIAFILSHALKLLACVGNRAETAQARRLGPGEWRRIAAITASEPQSTSAPVR